MNVRFLSNTPGALSDTYQFDTFGNQIASTGTTLNNYLFSAEQFDRNLSLYHLRARYYNVLTGRFETMDPYQGDIQQPPTLHRYAFTANNPVNFVDPTGRDVAEVSILWKVTTITLVGLQIFGPLLNEIYECAAEEIYPGPHTIGPYPPVDTIGRYSPTGGARSPEHYDFCEPPHYDYPQGMPMPGPATFPPKNPGFNPPPAEPVPTAHLNQEPETNGESYWLVNGVATESSQA